MATSLLGKSIKIVLLLFFSFAVLYFAKPFLVPLLIAALLAMLFLPLSVRLEKKRPKLVAVLMAMLVLLCAIGLIVFILTHQVSNISDNAIQIEKNISQKLQEVHRFVTNSLGILKEKSEVGNY